MNHNGTSGFQQLHVARSRQFAARRAWRIVARRGLWSVHKSTTGFVISCTPRGSERSVLPGGVGCAPEALDVVQLRIAHAHLRVRVPHKLTAAALVYLARNLGGDALVWPLRHR